MPIPPLSATPAPWPEPVVLEGRYVRLEPLDPAAHTAALWEAAGGAERDALWTYLFAGPFPERADFERHIAAKSAATDALFFAIVDQGSDLATGYACYMRIEPAHRSIEVGNILYAPALQRTRAATDAMYLMARHAFEDLGYRRYEWKCNAENQASRHAALRLGFTFEGIFRQHMIVKGRNRDTAWFSMLDLEWPARKAAFERWLNPANFDESGKQRTRLSAR
ncbi:MAG TPA: GNAT family N-acetyltransferase [Solibacterales bacterium]|nr:GNAT family N-acetyltransferase [Bryobacterales bacterium]